MMPSNARTRYKGASKYVATDEDRRRVATMIGLGIDQNAICAVLEITVPTLHRHFRRELDTAYTLVLTRMRGKLVAAADRGDVNALIFYNRTHGWSEKIIVEEAPPPGDFDCRTLSDEELDARINALRRKTVRVTKAPAIPVRRPG